jgi:hypothetical protein
MGATPKVSVRRGQSMRIRGSSRKGYIISRVAGTAELLFGRQMR